eukprot:174828_1
MEIVISLAVTCSSSSMCDNQHNLEIVKQLFDICGELTAISRTHMHMCRSYPLCLKVMECLLLQDANSSEPGTPLDNSPSPPLKPSSPHSSHGGSITSDVELEHDTLSLSSVELDPDDMNLDSGQSSGLRTPRPLTKPIKESERMKYINLPKPMMDVGKLSMRKLAVATIDNQSVAETIIKFFSQVLAKSFLVSPLSFETVRAAIAFRKDGVSHVVEMHHKSELIASYISILSTIIKANPAVVFKYNDAIETMPLIFRLCTDIIFQDHSQSSCLTVLKASHRIVAALLTAKRQHPAMQHVFRYTNKLTLYCLRQIRTSLKPHRDKVLNILIKNLDVMFCDQNADWRFRKAFLYYTYSSLMITNSEEMILSFLEIWGWLERQRPRLLSKFFTGCDRKGKVISTAKYEFVSSGFEVLRSGERRDFETCLAWLRRSQKPIRALFRDLALSSWNKYQNHIAKQKANGQTRMFKIRSPSIELDISTHSFISPSSAYNGSQSRAQMRNFEERVSEARLQCMKRENIAEARRNTRKVLLDSKSSESWVHIQIERQYVDSMRNGGYASVGNEIKVFRQPWCLDRRSVDVYGNRLKLVRPRLVSPNERMFRCPSAITIKSSHSQSEQKEQSPPEIEPEEEKREIQKPGAEVVSDGETSVISEPVDAGDVSYDGDSEMSKSELLRHPPKEPETRRNRSKMHIRIGSDSIKYPRSPLSPHVIKSSNQRNGQAVDKRPSVAGGHNSGPPTPRDAPSTTARLAQPLHVTALDDPNQDIGPALRKLITQVDAIFANETQTIIQEFCCYRAEGLKEQDCFVVLTHTDIHLLELEDEHKSFVTHTKFPYSSVRSLTKCRYLLQPLGLEIILDDDFTHLLVCSKDTREQMYTQITEKIYSIEDYQLNFDLPKWKEKKIKNLMKSWQNGTLSNFDYIMALNRAAGRTTDDITQYPVFPWVISAMNLESLDLSDASVYRNLSRPMGALNQARIDNFKQRYESLAASIDVDGPPPFHYGTHYSCAAITLNYLIRLDPYTPEALAMHKNHFDHWNRLFNSLPQTWSNASEGSNSDVRELTPEFYYLPEFLENGNDLYHEREERFLCDVKLPEWAHKSPLEFIRLHRRALESDHVSCQLHRWVDLIFGDAQQGKKAVESLNVFSHVTYENKVDLTRAGSDPLMKHALIEMIRSFGQTPTQLFKKPHPPRERTSSTGLLSRRWWFLKLVCSDTYANIDFEPSQSIGLCGSADGMPVGQIYLQDGRPQAVPECSLVIPRTSSSECVSWNYSDGTLRVCAIEGFLEDEKFIYQNMHDGRVTACCLSDDGMELLTGGTHGTICIWRHTKSIKDGAVSALEPHHYQFSGMLTGVHGHQVTDIRISSKYRMAVSTCGQIVAVWDLRKRELVRCIGKKWFQPPESPQDPTSPSPNNRGSFDHRTSQSREAESGDKTPSDNNSVRRSREVTSLDTLVLPLKVKPSRTTKTLSEAISPQSQGSRESQMSAESKVDDSTTNSECDARWPNESPTSSENSPRNTNRPRERSSHFRFAPSMRTGPLGPDGQPWIGLPLSCVAIDNETGTTAVSSGPSVVCWDVNGRPLAARVLSVRPSNTDGFDPNAGETVTCMIFSTGLQVYEGDDQNLLITGHKDGTINIFSVCHQSVVDSSISCCSRARADNARFCTMSAVVTSLSEGGHLSETCGDPMARRGAHPFVLLHRLSLKRHHYPISALSVPPSRNFLWSGDDHGGVCQWKPVCSDTEQDLSNDSESHPTVELVWKPMLAQDASELTVKCCHCARRPKSPLDTSTCAQCQELLCRECLLSHLRQHRFPANPQMPRGMLKVLSQRYI